MNRKINQNEVNVGVDVGKRQLDIFVRPLDIFITVSNDKPGIAKAIREIKKHKPTRIVIEATGRLEFEFVQACAKAKLPIVVANPAHIKKFAGAIGQLAKTDKLDAKLIAHYAEAIKPTIVPLKPDDIRELSDLLARRGQLMGLQTMEKNRLQIMPKELSSFIKPLLTTIKKQLDKIDHKLSKLVVNNEEFKLKNDIIQSVPGLGNVVTFSLISNMPELGYITNKEASALIGVAPLNRESGIYKGHRKIRGGRPQIRTVMYMAMLSAIQCNPLIKSTYKRLLEKGKPKKVAIIACIRKMIVILNSMLRDGVMWNPKLVN